MLKMCSFSCRFEDENQTAFLSIQIQATFSYAVVAMIAFDLT